MYQHINIATHARMGDLPQFSLKYHDNGTYRSLLIVYPLDEHDCIVFHDRELPRKKTYEMRSDGIWADINCEAQGEHWSFSLESFALRVPVDEYLAYKEMMDTLLIGDRIAYGYELDLTSHDGEDWTLSGDIFLENGEYDIGQLSSKLIFQ